MREVNNNTEFGKVPQIKNLGKAEEIAPVAPLEVEENSISSFDNPKAEILGRSHVNSLSALQQDVAFGFKNPQAIAMADKFFDNAYRQLQSQNDPNAYEKASELASAYVDEFHK